MPMNWLLAGPGSPYVLDITATAGTTQIIFATSFPGDQSVLTAADADNLASNTESVVAALPGVSSVTMAQVQVNGELWRNVDNAYPGALVYPATQWSNWLGGWPADPKFAPLASTGYKVTVSLGIIARSPADGVLTSAQLATVVQATGDNASFIAGMPVQLVQQQLTPASAM